MAGQHENNLFFAFKASTLRSCVIRKTRWESPEDLRRDRSRLTTFAGFHWTEHRREWVRFWEGDLC
jgi:hypothetical protein